MKRIPVASLVAGLCVAAFCNRAVALPPPPTAPFTLWNFLGIPQGLNKIRDAASNRRGNFPGAERKPPLKALADPSNLESPVSAIKKAAEIKSEEDMAPQKIKAVKYLATVGCGCYGGVKEALMESLEDCTEEVRYRTVLAIEDAATMHCDVCNRDCCCDEELTKKLAELAYEIEKVTKFLAKRLPEVSLPVQGIAVFFDPSAILQIEDTPLPVMHAKQLKDYIRRQPKGPTLSREMIAQLDSILKVAATADTAKS